MQQAVTTPVFVGHRVAERLGAVDIAGGERFELCALLGRGARHCSRFPWRAVLTVRMLQRSGSPCQYLSMAEQKSKGGGQHRRPEIEDYWPSRSHSATSSSASSRNWSMFDETPGL